MPYRVWVTNDVPTAADFNALFSDPLIADVATDENLTTATYTDLTTAGPAVTMSMVNGQVAMVVVSCRMGSVVDAAFGRMSFAVSGASTLAASDANSAEGFIVKTGVNGWTSTVSRTSPFTATATGSVTFTSKYRSDGTTVMHFVNRRIMAKKV